MSTRLCKACWPDVPPSPLERLSRSIVSPCDGCGEMGSFDTFVGDPREHASRTAADAYATAWPSAMLNDGGSAARLREAAERVLAVWDRRATGWLVQDAFDRLRGAMLANEGDDPARAAALAHRQAQQCWQDILNACVAQLPPDVWRSNAGADHPCGNPLPVAIKAALDAARAPAQEAHQAGPAPRLSPLAAWSYLPGHAAPPALPSPPPAPTVTEMIAQRDAEIQRLQAAALVPGKMRCAKCNFALVRAVLCMTTGRTGSGGSETEPCPNGCGPLWPVTWEQEVKDAWGGWDALLERAEAAEARLKAAIPEGWKLVPEQATLDMLLAVHDGPVMAGDHEMDKKDRAWLMECWEAFLGAAPKPGA